MIKNGKNEVHENDKLLATIMAMLNITVVALVVLGIWSIFSIVENSAAISQLMNGNFMP